MILTGICAVQAQTNKGTSAEAVLIDLENRWVAALVKADTASLDAIFASTYVDTDEGSGRTDKAGLLAVLKSGQLKMTSIKLSDMRVYLYYPAGCAVYPSAWLFRVLATLLFIAIASIVAANDCSNPLVE